MRNASDFLMAFAQHGNISNVSMPTPLTTASTGADPFTMVVWYMHLYLTPVVVFIGLIGNCLSFVVFMCTRQRHLSSSVYLAALALVDSSFLLQLLTTWLVYVRIFLFHRQGWCQIFIYISYVSSFLSVWLVVAFTVERFIACSYPLRRNSMCTTGRAKVVTVSLSVFAIVVYSYGAWTSGTIFNGRHTECICLPRFQGLVMIFSNIDTFITLVVPVLAIIIMNVKIVYKLIYLDDKRKAMTQYSHRSDSGRVVNQSSTREQRGHENRPEAGHSSRNRSQVKVTKMLLVVSTMFVVLNLPSHAIRVYNTLQRFINPAYLTSRALLQAQSVSNFIYYCNFSVNFFLYSMCGRNFRNALSTLILKLKRNVVQCYRNRLPYCCQPTTLERHQPAEDIKFQTAFRNTQTRDTTLENQIAQIESDVNESINEL